MDAALLDLAPTRAVVVIPLASERGSDYARTGDNARRYFGGLGADVVVPPDPRADTAPAVAALSDPGMVVLTGGSPRRLRDALVATGLDELVRAAARRGALVMGASAGAMVACEVTLLPRWRGNPDAGPGIGLVTDAAVVPHYDGKRAGWVAVAQSVAPTVLGIPECSGVLVEGERLTGLGATPTTVITAGGSMELPLA